jgi:hypothetical protein
MTAGEPPLGAFEVWALCRNEMKAFFNDAQYRASAFKEFFLDFAMSDPLRKTRSRTNE